ncbi:MAG: hypothetical protein R3C28_33765 [Pirellulaceae bacterium]
MDELLFYVKTQLISEGVPMVRAVETDKRDIVLAVAELLRDNDRPTTGIGWIDALAERIFLRMAEAGLREQVGLGQGLDFYADESEDAVNGLGSGVERVLQFAKRRCDELRTNDVDPLAFLLGLHKRIAHETALLMARQLGRNLDDAGMIADAAHRTLTEGCLNERG